MSKNLSRKYSKIQRHHHAVRRNFLIIQGFFQYYANNFSCGFRKTSEGISGALSETVIAAISDGIPGDITNRTAGVVSKKILVCMSFC